MSWGSNFDGRAYTRAQWLAHVSSLGEHDLDWVEFICLHNTSSPTIRQWQNYPEHQRILNLQNYYQHQMGWHAGPHGFIPPDESEVNTNGVCIWGFTNLSVPGVHASCFNRNSLGFEMVGDFDVSPFDAPPGSYVRDNAVFALAVLYNWLELTPTPYVYDSEGLHYHIECRRDNHSCPGSHARNKPDMVSRITAEMARLKTLPAPKSPLLQMAPPPNLEKPPGFKSSWRPI